MNATLWRTVAALYLAGAAAPLHAQSVQYRSPAGVEYRSLPDSGPIARARDALAADPRSIRRFMELGAAQSAARQFREAVETYTAALAVAPDDPMLYRWRGHRHLSLRDFARAEADLARGLLLGSGDYGLLYHLGIVHFARGEFSQAAATFTRALQSPPNAGEAAGSTDWLWMALMRAGRPDQARALLERRPDSLPANNAYARRLQLYRGEIAPEAVLTPADTGDVQVATLAYGAGNWHLVQGDTARAVEWFERSVRSGGWPAFGFIVSEQELRRLRGKP
jgi:tetratricopeptide (TPR) repeat protein